MQESRAEQKAEREKTLRDMWQENRSIEDICKALGGKSKSAVYLLAGRLGLPRRAPPGRKPPVAKPPAGKRLKCYKKPDKDKVYAPAPRTRVEPKRRPCLSCKNDFTSTGIFNRICARCKAQPAWCDGDQSLTVVAVV